MKRRYINLKNITPGSLELEGICEGEALNETLTHARVMSTKELKTTDDGRVEIKMDAPIDTITPCPICGSLKVTILYIEITIGRN